MFCHFHNILKQGCCFLIQGFLIVSSFFKDSELDPVLEDMEKEVDKIVEKLYNAGKIKSKSIS